MSDRTIALLALGIAVLALAHALMPDSDHGGKAHTFALSTGWPFITDRSGWRPDRLAPGVATLPRVPDMGPPDSTAALRGGASWLRGLGF